MSAPTANIPFEGQSAPGTVRDCGAACLSMVYGSFGKPVPRAEIWPAVAGKNRAGSSISSLSHLMVRDAIARDFAAVAVQVRHPLQALRLCQEAGIRAILNHRLSRDSSAGHYTVLVGLDDKDVVLHDPYHGPARRVSHADLLELWQPRPGNLEVMGYLLIGIAAEPSAVASCWLCQKPLPPAIPCPHCKQQVGLQPNTFLGCIDTTCIVRMWNYVCCPACDCGFTVTPPTAPGAAASTVVSEPAASGPSAGSSGEPLQAPALCAASLNFDRFFAQMDKFCAHIQSLPAAAGNPAIQRQIESLLATKQTLLLARTEAIANEKLASDQMAKLVAESEKAAAAHQQKVDEINRPAPPLDGNALGRALMKNLGFTR